ncbi:hypothetical protein D3C85_1377000 [compost metagenome]
MLAFFEDLLVAAVLRPGSHRRLQHAQARALVFEPDQEARTQCAHAAVLGSDYKRAIVLVAGLDRDFTFVQHDQALLLVEADIHCRMGVEADQGAIGEAQGTLLTRAGALIGQPVAQRLMGTDPAQQTHHQHQAGQAAAQLAYPLAQTGA